ncbi:glycosyltransferase, partial [Flavobacterium cupreum]
TYRLADMLAVQTEGGAAKVPALFPGLKRVGVVANPVPAAVGLNHKRHGAGRKVLLSLGRLSSEKQVDRIVDAFAAAAGQFDQWELHLYGEGPQEPALRAQIDALQLQERVFIKGRTSEPWQVMAGADAFVMASEYDWFPNALLE